MADEVKLPPLDEEYERIMAELPLPPPWTYTLAKGAECRERQLLAALEREQALEAKLREMRPAVVTSDCGVVEGIFTSWDAALSWAKQHRMNESNIRGGVPFHDIQFARAELQKEGQDGR